MFSYAADTTNHTCYRPDLKNVIEKWIASVPESDWAYFVGFRVGTRGEFVAKFMKAPTRGGALRLVTFTVDHNYAEMVNDSGHLWYDKVPVSYTSANLTMAVDAT